jgi:hypothetical protein
MIATELRILANDLDAANREMRKHNVWLAFAFAIVTALLVGWEAYALLVCR